jgi:arylsulfatase A-like enzyme
VPLIIAAPWLPESHGKRTDSLTELIDVFPTMSELAGLPPPPNGSAPLNGVSQAATLLDPAKQVKGFAISQYPRCPVKVRCGLWSNGGKMAETMSTRDTPCNINRSYLARRPLV